MDAVADVCCLAVRFFGLKAKNPKAPAVKREARRIGATGTFLLSRPVIHRMTRSGHSRLSQSSVYASIGGRYGSADKR